VGDGTETDKVRFVKVVYPWVQGETGSTDDKIAIEKEQVHQKGPNTREKGRYGYIIGLGEEAKH